MTFDTLLDNNHRWVAERTQDDPSFFRRRASEHRPQFLWIGCSDARVPADVLTQTEPGQMFVHRNVANLVVPTDANLLAVVQYAVEVLGVQDIVVCGHEGCGGVHAALGAPAPAHVEHWLTHVRTVARLHDEELEPLAPAERWLRLVELNVVEQVYTLARTPIVQGAWAAGRTLRLHGVVYGLSDGYLRDLGVMLDGTSADPRVRPLRRGGAAEGMSPSVPSGSDAAGARRVG